MKNLIKNLAVFIVLTIIISSFMGCENTSATKGDGDKTSIGGNSEFEKTSKDDQTKDKSSKDVKYPPAPEAIATAEIDLLDGEKFKLDDHKGKVVLFNLWAIWCGPCIQEMPHLNELHEKFKDKGLIIVGLNTGDDEGNKDTVANIEKFAQKQNLQYKIGIPERPLIGAFFNLGQVGGAIPQSFLFNRKGELTGVFQGGNPKTFVIMKENVEKIVNAE